MYLELLRPGSRSAALPLDSSPLSVKASDLILPREFCRFSPGELVRDRDGVPARELEAEAVPELPVIGGGATDDTVVEVGFVAALEDSVTVWAAATLAALAFISSAVAT